MEISKYQNEVDQWIKTYGVRYFNIPTNTMILMEEVGEFARLMARFHGEQSFKNAPSEVEAKELIADEIADIFFVLTCLSNQMDINIAEAIEKNFTKKTKRDIQRHMNNKKITE